MNFRLALTDIKGNVYYSDEVSEGYHKLSESAETLSDLLADASSIYFTTSFGQHLVFPLSSVLHVEVLPA